MSIAERRSTQALISGQRLRGFTLIEIIIFMVIVGIAFGALISVLGTALKGGADMVSQKQALAIAESIVEEITLRPFTYCDPDDPAASTTTALSTADCTTTYVEGIGPETGETSPTNFDNVNDFAGYAYPDPLTGFSVSSLTITNEALDGIATTESLHIRVTVTGPGNAFATLDTYRTRYAPNFTN